MSSNERRKWICVLVTSMYLLHFLSYVSTGMDSPSGLRYDDLYDEMYDMDIQEALSRLPREVVDARSARIKRAMDLSMKHVYLPKELQAKQTPYEYYLQDALNMVKLERKERTELGSSMPYNREIP